MIAEESRQQVASAWPEVENRLRAFLRARVDEPAVADDLLQEVFLRAWQGRLESPGRLMAWLYRITRNVLTDYRRLARHRREVGGKDPDTLDLPWEEDEQIAERELARCLEPMIRRLPDSYREALELVDLQGLTQQAAARRAELSLPGMKSRVQRGRRQLQTMLLDCCHVDVDSKGLVLDYAMKPGSDCGPACRKREIIAADRNSG